MKAVLVLLLSLYATSALAAPCPPPMITVGWAQSFFQATTIKGFIYDQLASILYVTTTANQNVAYFGVPVGTAQAFTTTAQPDAFYANNVAARFHASLETESCGLLQTEMLSYLWTH